MRYLCLIAAMSVSTTTQAETMRDIFNQINGKVIEFTGRVWTEGEREKPFIRIGNEGVYPFDFSLVPKDLRKVKAICTGKPYDYTCEITGKAELDTSSDRIHLYIFAVDKVTDLQ